MSRALSLTSAAGGYAVPVELDPTIMPTSNLAINPIRAIANVKQISVDTFNGVTAGRGHRRLPGRGHTDDRHVSDDRPGRDLDRARQPASSPSRSRSGRTGALCRARWQG